MSSRSTTLSDSSGAEPSLRPRRKPWPELKRSTTGIGWPIIARGAAASIGAIVRQLEKSEWLTTEEILAQQYRQLLFVARYAAKHSAFFRQRLASAGMTADQLATPEGLRKLPILRRRDIQSEGNGVYCDEVPADHMPVGTNKTSGSTGEPVVIKRTMISQLMASAQTMRDFFWHLNAFDLRHSVIRATNKKYALAKTWGPPTDIFFRTGPLQSIPIDSSIRQQIKWLSEFQPHILFVYPNVLFAIAQFCEKHGVAFPNLQLIRTTSETLSPDIRQKAEQVFSVRVIDNYSSQEAGIIAAQCPDSELYHVMAESLIVEVIAEDGRPCGPGEVGRVLITDLHNFATPLIRYDIRDFAEVGPPCPCGRGLPTLRRIAGRERNLMLMPDGSRRWPKFGFSDIRKIAPVLQYQFVQHDLIHLEARLVTEMPLSSGTEEKIRERMREALGFPFAINFTYFPKALPRSENGKFEDFVCKVRT